MINKYWLYKKVLENKYNTSELENEHSNLSYKIFGIHVPKEDIYNSRVNSIKDYMERCIEEIPSLTGKEARSLLDQYNSILADLRGSWKQFEIIRNSTATFKEALEDQLGVMLWHIYDYEKAEKLFHGERNVHVNLDGNFTKCFENGKEKRIMTKVIDNNVTIEQCRNIIKMLAEKYNCHPKQIAIDLSIYTETKDNECGDFPEEFLIKKEVFYKVDNDEMTIYENDKPIYNNCHGVICDDPVALADSI